MTLLFILAAFIAQWANTVAHFAADSDSRIPMARFLTDAELAAMSTERGDAESQADVPPEPARRPGSAVASARFIDSARDGLNRLFAPPAERATPSLRPASPSGVAPALSPQTRNFLSLVVADARLSPAESAVRAADWRVADARLGDGGVLSFAYYEPIRYSDQIGDYFVGSPLSALGQTAQDGARQSFAVNYYSRPFDLGIDSRLDFDVTPRAGLTVGPDGSSAGAGALVRLGEFSAPRADAPRWYFFAGADAEALTLDPRAGFRLTESIRYEDRVIVGDIQAGVAMRLGGGDLSLAYVMTERVYESPSYGITERDDFAVLSYTRRW